MVRDPAWSLGGRLCAASRITTTPSPTIRMRLDPLDPNTARHSPLCEFVSATDPSVLRAVLRVTPKDGYSWVACNSCDYGWQIQYVAESVG